MTVGELLVKKLDEMSEQDYLEFCDALGYQFGMILITTIKGLSLKDISEDNLVKVLAEQKIVETGLGGYLITYDASPAGIQRMCAKLYEKP